jgi:hypothetical protein
MGIIQSIFGDREVTNSTDSEKLWARVRELEEQVNCLVQKPAAEKLLAEAATLGLSGKYIYGKYSPVICEAAYAGSVWGYTDGRLYTLPEFRKFLDEKILQNHRDGKCMPTPVSTSAPTRRRTRRSK